MLSKFTKWYSNAFIQKRLKPRPKTFNWCLQRAAPFHAQAVHLLSHVVLQRGPIQWGGANPHVYIAIPRCTRTVHCKCWDMFFYLHEKLENPISNISWYFIQESERRSTSNIYMFNRFHWAIGKWFGVFILTLKPHCSKPSRNQILFTIVNV